MYNVCKIYPSLKNTCAEMRRIRFFRVTSVFKDACIYACVCVCMYVTLASAAGGYISS